MKEFANRENVTKLLKGLVNIESPYFHEDQVMDFVNDWLNSNGLPACIHEFHEAKITDFHGKNVVGCLDSGKPGPVIYLGGHLDTVKLCDGWSKPPFEGVVEGDYMYGVGALDMKSGDAAMARKIWKNLLSLLWSEEKPEGFRAVPYGRGQDGSPLVEIPWITTNFTAQWCLKAIVTAEFIPESRPETLAELNEWLRKDPPEYRMYGA